MLLLDLTRARTSKLSSDELGQSKDYRRSSAI